MSLPVVRSLLLALLVSLLAASAEEDDPAFQVASWALADGLPDAQVISLTESMDGYLWVATPAGLSYFGGHRFRSPPIEELPFLANGSIKTLKADAEGRLWVLLESGDLWVGEKGVFHRVTAVDGWPEIGVHGLYADGAKRIIPSSKDGWVYRVEGRRLVRWLEPCLLSKEPFVGINVDYAGQVWVRHGRELFWWDGGWKALTPEDSSGPFLAVRTGAAREGGMWLSDRLGARRFHQGAWRGDRRVFPEVREGLHMLFEDAQGYLWVLGGGGRNIWRYDRSGMLHTTGLRAIGDTATSLLEDRRGHLWMSTNLSGLVQWRSREWRPIELPADVPAPRPIWGQETTLALDSMTANQGFTWRNGTLGFGGPANVPMIPPARSNVSFQLNALTRESGPLRVEVRLNDSTTWTPTSPALAVSFPKLTPGRHALHARVLGADGKALGPEAEFPFEAQRPFWQTAGFLSAAVACCLAGLLWAYGAHIRRLRAEQVRQRELSQRLIESQETERQRIAADLHDSLGQKLLVIQNAAQFGLRHGHDSEALAEQLRRVSATATECVDEVRHITRALRPYQLDHLGLTLAVKSLAAQAEKSGETRIEMDLDDLDGVVPASQEIIVYRIFQEGLANALRHSGARNITLCAKRQETRLDLSVEDDGRGFDPKARPQSDTSGGFGLSSLRERVRMMSGQMDFRSGPGGGAVLHVSIPLPS